MNIDIYVHSNITAHHKHGRAAHDSHRSAFRGAREASPDGIGTPALPAHDGAVLLLEVVCGDFLVC